jgi:macrolide transport system ATP-binding/permease protein
VVGILNDVRFAIRVLLRHPLVTATATVSMALGIGLNSVLFMYLDAYFYRPLPVPDADRVVALSAASADVRDRSLSYPNYRDLRERLQAFDGVVAHRRVSYSFARSRDHAREMRVGMLVSDNFFSALGVTPAAGRLFADVEARPGQDAVVVLSHNFWRSTLGGDPDVVGGEVWINGLPLTVVGVAAEMFTGMDAIVRPAFYVPAPLGARLTASDSDPLNDRAARAFIVHGRLRGGVSLPQAAEEVAPLWAALQREYPDVNRTGTLAVRTVADERQQGDPDSAALAVLVMLLAGVVLIIACANVANLLAQLAHERGGEIALRVALGAGRFRLLRQLLAESVLLAAVGGVGGVGIAFLAIRVIGSIEGGSDLPIVIVPRLDARTLAVSALASLATAMLVGVAPARYSLRTRLVGALRDSVAGHAKRQRMIGRHVLVVGQVALSMVLLVTAGLLLEAFRKSQALSPGYETEERLMLTLDTSQVRYTPERTREFYRQLRDGAATLPGVQSATLTSWLPLDRGGETRDVVPEGYPMARDEQRVRILTAVVDDGFFGTMQVPLRQGRPFNTADGEDGRAVAIVNEAFAARYWQGQQAVGRRLRLGTEPTLPLLEVVGVVATGRYLSITEPPTPFLFLPYAQHPRSRMTLIVSAPGAGDVLRVAGDARHLVRRLDENQPIFDLRSVAGFYEGRTIAVQRRIMRLVGAMGALGLGLALVGIYGLVAFTAARRTYEIGIRMAIGADASMVRRLFLRQGLVVAMIGVVIGGVGSALVGSLLGAQFVGLGSLSPIAFVVVPLVLIVATLAASYLPARRASLLDPLKALRG